MKPVAFPLFFFFFSLNLRVSSAVLPLQLIALLSLKSAIKDPHSILSNWDPSPIFSKPGFQQNPVWCSWTGVKCDQKTAQITSLDLSAHNLSGGIPRELGYLKGLNYLNLSRNAFDGPLPSSIFELTELRTLDISHNNFNSTFPPGISNLRFLRVLNCYSNSFSGTLPSDLAGHRYIEYLNLGGSYFRGGIPAGYGSFPRLSFLYLAGNALNGSIPEELGRLWQLEHIEIGYNQLSGSIPGEFSKLLNLKYMDISNANLSGPLASELGNLTALETLLLFKNGISGSIPQSFSSFEALKMLDLSDNHLSGEIPSAISSMKELRQLSLMRNRFSGEIPEGIGDLPSLEILYLWNNSLTGSLPSNLGSNGKLQHLDVSSNSLTGLLPQTLCHGNQLVRLILFSNRFTAEIPNQLANCTALSRVRIHYNSLNGEIPLGFGKLPNLTFMDLSKNNLTGQIPSDLGNSPKLEYLNVSENNFGVELPKNIWRAPNLQIFSAWRSGLTGEIPDFIGCQSLYKIELEGNSLNGSIPWDIGHCEKLISLNLRRNSLVGIIPWEISTLPSITDVDLSNNYLTGTIPSNFGNCSTLESFNVSYNLLTGPIPSSGDIFPNLHPSSFAGNEGLCGKLIGKPCTAGSLDAGAAEVRQPQPRKSTSGPVVWITAAAFGAGLFILIAGIRFFHGRGIAGGRRDLGPWKLTAFQRLNFTADDVLECLSTSDRIIGMGSTGTVYRAEMPGGEIVAVKKLWGKQKETVRMRKGGVLAEVDVLGNVRHRNIVRLLGCCSNKETAMLLYEYMPNGSLDEFLHGNNKGGNLAADWLTRYRIALGVAQGICYLHHDCDPVIVHRDLKPSNILLDAEMEARVADFGVAKLIMRDESMSVVAGSYGYIAPEYAYTLQVDEKSDIYSYGVVLLEIVSGKRSVDREFGDGNNIVDWVRSKIKTKDGINDVLDKNAGASCSPVREEMMVLLRVALLCTSRNPADRPSMRDVVSMLQEAKPKRKLPDGNGGGGDRDHRVIEISGRRGGDGTTLVVDKN
ncbi:hypothetical protein Nepgr_021540 [Nepenthes gracilis]|uniref:non-specific serine/threonine protein kinase n=1 Tax=Nepenthes gracilis TaxID=150966 RepID=A0AAD3SZK9_NEPGR|nr:hypothetical protein Nepgr_021540 [Nepenthes gracilis]